MNSKMVEVFRKIREMHHAIYQEMQPLIQEFRRCNNMEELADAALAFRECHKYADDLRKELARAQDTCEKIACLVWTKDSEGESIRTDHVTATPDIKMTASIPRKKNNPEMFAKLMNHLKIPHDLWENEEEVVRIHWPGFTSFTTTLEKQGRPLPPGIDPDKTYPVYKLRLRKRKDIDE